MSTVDLTADVDPKADTERIVRQVRSVKRCPSGRPTADQLATTAKYGNELVRLGIDPTRTYVSEPDWPHEPPVQMSGQGREADYARDMRRSDAFAWTVILGVCVIALAVAYRVLFH